MFILTTIELVVALVAKLFLFHLQTCEIWRRHFGASKKSYLVKFFNGLLSLQINANRKLPTTNVFNCFLLQFEKKMRNWWSRWTVNRHQVNKAFTIRALGPSYDRPYTNKQTKNLDFSVSTTTRQKNSNQNAVLLQYRSRYKLVEDWSIFLWFKLFINPIKQSEGVKMWPATIFYFFSVLYISQ